MIKKIISFIIVLLIFISNPSFVNAERLIANPTIISVDNAPHSAKPVKKAKKKVAKRNLKLGMKGSDVLALQKFLIKKSVGPAAQALAKNKATGNFGQLTKEALEEFQRSRGLAVDGVAGSKIRTLYSA